MSVQEEEMDELIKRLRWLKNKIIEINNLEDYPIKNMEITLLGMQSDIIMEEIDNRNKLGMVR